MHLTQTCNILHADAALYVDSVASIMLAATVAAGVVGLHKGSRGMSSSSIVSCQQTLFIFNSDSTVYRALLTSAVLGIGHRIHTTKKKQ